MSTKTFTTVEGLNAALRKLPKETSKELRDASVTIASDVSKKASGKASALGGAAGLVASTLRGTRDKVPVIRMGGAKRLPPKTVKGKSRKRTGDKQTVGNIIWGAEFGAKSYPQFSPHLGKTGYFLWPTVRAEQGNILDEYSKALLKAINDI
jgi:hypothetical protein